MKNKFIHLFSIRFIQVNKLQLNHGVLVVLSLVFHVYVVVVLIDLVKVPLVICVVVVECMPH